MAGGPSCWAASATPLTTASSVCYSGDPFAVVVRETRGGVTREMTAADPRWAGHLTLLTAGTPVHIPIKSLGAPPE